MQRARTRNHVHTCRSGRAVPGSQNVRPCTQVDTVRDRLIDALVPWFLAGERELGVAELEALLGEPEVAPLAAQLGYRPEMTLVQRERLEVDLRRAVRQARAAEAVRLAQDAGLPARTDRAFSLALADVVAALREAARRLAAAERAAVAVGDTPAEAELGRLGARGRELASACELLYESRALRGG